MKRYPDYLFILSSSTCLCRCANAVSVCQNGRLNVQIVKIPNAYGVINLGYIKFNHQGKAWRGVVPALYWPHETPAFPLMSYCTICINHNTAERIVRKPPRVLRCMPQSGSDQDNLRFKAGGTSRVQRAIWFWEAIWERSSPLALSTGSSR